MPDLVKRVLFIDRDGTLILEPADEQIDSFAKLKFYPGALQYLPKIAKELDFELILVSNQDGLGTSSHPEENFWPVHHFVIDTFKGEGVVFAEEHIDRTFPHENADTRKPGIGMLKGYFDTDTYNLSESFVIGDRINDVKLAHNLGAKAIWLRSDDGLGQAENLSIDPADVALETTDWKAVYEFLKLGTRSGEHHRKTNETDIFVAVNLDGSGKSSIDTGLPFFDHMLDQIARHGALDLTVKAKGDLHIDEHHTIEDTGIALGELFLQVLGNKRGIERYAYTLPMDDCLAQVAIDFGGRNWIVWDAAFKREKIGDMPTEMFFHFFKSFSDAAKANLNIKAEGENEHHKIEAIFKAFAKSIKKAVRRDADNMQLPSTKGVL
ncbi:bifunctional histidinol-phosphatase/imidazoleglycerol-phosphate dehydratase HisB [Sphingobacterium psychroaquaticum]|uniref:bifunctional histidinol-phosphatase/imidazoleglycerol-phosphate dehydratase HisB n=1 Tax=Sphingobacterium psychroaquaticum TaxID=561061 RepID=UPI00106AABFC|nr:bifunctional histidinol-phosphatase/imidazoleglycerol-phosphate dehydratase HisB [Sphingobacterium psychroaquaticum]QBQ40063.1 bifunctional histidinol-phosphatase/imidazoleglycerol-phosphate dehydratase HisB [Sphingobacterium psychroaquaticum]